MQTADDYYKSLWETARKSSQYPSDLARSKDPTYTDLLAQLGKDVIGDANSTVIPILAGKSMDDWNVWMDWESKTIEVRVELGGWAGGQVPGGEAAATKALADAEADIATIRK